MLDSFMIIRYQVVLGIAPIGLVFMEVHEKIKLLRLTKAWSQEEVAAKLDMSPNGYGSIERGETDVNLSRLKKIAQLYGIEPAALFDDGKNVFNFNGNTQYDCTQQHNQNYYGIGSCSPEYLQLKSELEKQIAINQQLEKDNVYLKGLVDSLVAKSST
ncbi:MAG: helix-turn-helix transcriptional regulator [Methylococcales bacterium]